LFSSNQNRNYQAFISVSCEERSRGVCDKIHIRPAYGS
jgi:hypothetical protein